MVVLRGRKFCGTQTASHSYFKYCLINLANVSNDDEQLDAAEKVASRVIDLLPETGENFLVCQGHCILGNVYHDMGDTKEAIHHFEVALGTASTLNWHGQLFWIHHFREASRCPRVPTEADFIWALLINRNIVLARWTRPAEAHNMGFGSSRSRSSVPPMGLMIPSREHVRTNVCLDHQ